MDANIAPLLFLVGPTAVGKSAIAVELALHVDGEIVSADSMQVYRGMDIGTAKLSLAERRGVPHHLLDVLDVDEPWDVARFRRMAEETIGAIHGRKHLPIVVGGSGLYVRALTQGLFQGPGRDESLRQELEKLETGALRQRLRECDPVSAQRIHDRRRMIRALECFATAGRPISELQTQWKASAKAGGGEPFLLVGLDRPRPEIYERCNRRVEIMFEAGLVDEVRRLVRRGLAPDSTAGRAIGYAEGMEHLAGRLSLPEAIAITQKRTRQFAKRQWTWFRREPGIKWLEIAAGESVATTARRILPAS
jgi:tRNA dimethylallyltransferase